MSFFHFLLHLHKKISLCFKVETKIMKVMAFIIEDFLASNFWLKMCGMVFVFLYHFNFSYDFDLLMTTEVGSRVKA
jgi:uncharacterized membrane protein